MLVKVQEPWRVWATADQTVMVPSRALPLALQTSLWGPSGSNGRGGAANTHTSGKWRSAPSGAGTFHALTVPGDSFVGSLDCELALQDPVSGHVATGRALMCSCYEGRWCSITLRMPDALVNKLQAAGMEEAAGPLAPSPVGGATTSARGGQQAKYVFDARLIAEVICGLVRPAAASRPAGVLLIAGSTNSGKSEIARACVRRLLEVPPGKRRPHLVTAEQPVEEFLYTTTAGEPCPQQAVDYTPRTLSRDAPSVRHVLNDALRMAPAVLYVAEVREPEDWPHIVRFGASGHLVVTTSHAATLVEAMAAVFRACGATTPAGHQEIARSLLGVVHLHQLECAGRNGRKGPKAQLPALWRRTDAALHNLVADGFRSLQPGRLDAVTHGLDPAAAGEMGSVGRLALLGKLLDRAALAASTADRLREAASNLDLNKE